MSTFFQGLNDIYGIGANAGGQQQAHQPLICFPGVVVDICMGANLGSGLYESERDIGKIRFRNLLSDTNAKESTLEGVAYPLDRSIARYPYPGEEVLLFKVVGENTVATVPTMVGLCFYTFVVSAMHNVTYNQNPFIGTDWQHVDVDNPKITYDTAKKRFDNKAVDINTVKDGNDKIKVYKQLKPQEGDFILQGRFGTSVRFGSTAVNGNTPWSSDNLGGVSGDGIIVLRADKDYVVDEKSMLVTENIDADDSSIYICTSQNIQLTLACSKRMRSWATVYDLPDIGTENAADVLSNQTDTSEVWQKVLDSSKPVNETFNNVD